MPDPTETLRVVERVKEMNPRVDVVARTHGDAEAARLRGISARVQAVHAERELSVQMARYALRRFGVSSAEAESIAQGLRGRGAIGQRPPGRPSVVTRIRGRLGPRTAAESADLAGRARAAGPTEEPVPEPRTPNLG
jgi:hypothetical protein